MAKVRVSGYSRGGKRAGKVSSYVRGSGSDAGGRKLKVGDRVGYAGGFGGGIVSAIGTPKSFSRAASNPNAIKVSRRSQGVGVHSTWESGRSLIKKQSGSSATVNKRLGMPKSAQLTPNNAMQPGAKLPRKPTKRQLSVATKGSRVGGRTTRRRK